MFGMKESMILNWTEMLSMEMIIPVKKKNPENILPRT